jgi:hypothetical protein
MVDSIECVFDSSVDGDAERDAHDAVPDFEFVELAEIVAELVEKGDAEFVLMERVTDGLPDASPLCDALGVLDDERESVRDARADAVVVAVAVPVLVPDDVLVGVVVVEAVPVAVAVAVADFVVDDDCEVVAVHVPTFPVKFPLKEADTDDVVDADIVLVAVVEPVPVLEAVADEEPVAVLVGVVDLDALGDRDERMLVVEVVERVGLFAVEGVLDGREL